MMYYLPVCSYTVDCYKALTLDFPSINVNEMSPYRKLHRNNDNALLNNNTFLFHLLIHACELTVIKMITKFQNTLKAFLSIIFYS